MRKIFVLGLAIVLLIVTAIPAVAAPARDTTYTVQPGDTLGKIAAQFGTTVAALVDVNDLANPNLIFAGQTLIIPGAGGPVAPVAPAAPSSPAQPANGLHSWTVAADDPIYSGDGRVVDIKLTVTNGSVSPAIAGGRYTPHKKPDGNYEDVALASSIHGQFEQPDLGDALVWRVVVHLSDGSTHTLGAGCRFLEVVHAEGDEPLTRTPEGVWLTWYHYIIHIEGGWWDCGNVNRENPPDILPGQSGSSWLHVYLVNPHNLATDGSVVGTPYPGRTVTGLDVTVFDPSGAVVGTQFVPVAAP